MGSLAAIRESEFQTQVIASANLRGWWVHHHHDSRRSSPGWPDLVLIRRERILFAELKTDSGKVTAEQEAVIGMLIEAGQTVYLWRPRDWETIQRVLR